MCKRLSVPHDARDWVRHVGRFGYAARALTFGLIGGFLIAAASASRSSTAETRLFLAEYQLRPPITVALTSARPTMVEGSLTASLDRVNMR